MQTECCNVSFSLHHKRRTRLVDTESTCSNFSRESFLFTIVRQIAKRESWNSPSRRPSAFEQNGRAFPILLISWPFGCFGRHWIRPLNGHEFSETVRDTAIAKIKGNRGDHKMPLSGENLSSSRNCKRHVSCAVSKWRGASKSINCNPLERLSGKIFEDASVETRVKRRMICMDTCTLYARQDKRERQGRLVSRLASSRLAIEIHRPQKLQVNEFPMEQKKGNKKRARPLLAEVCHARIVILDDSKGMSEGKNVRPLYRLGSRARNSTSLIQNTSAITVVPRNCRKHSPVYNCSHWSEISLHAMMLDGPGYVAEEVRPLRTFEQCDFKIGWSRCVSLSRRGGRRMSTRHYDETGNGISTNFMLIHRVSLIDFSTVRIRRGRISLSGQRITVNLLHRMWKFLTKRATVECRINCMRWD